MTTDWTGLRYWDDSCAPKGIASLWNPQSLEDVFWNEMKCVYQTPTVGLHEFTDAHERDISIRAVRDKKTDYQLDDVTYNINKYGFRGDWQLGCKEKSVAFFGCSFTFGIGIAEQDSFTTLIGKHLNARVFNFGVPGGSINRAARYYSLASREQRFNYTIFLVPHIGRIEIPIAKRNVEMINLVPNWASISKDEERKRMQIYNALDNNYLAADTLRSIDHCVQIAKQQHTRVYFTSWDMPTYDLIYDYLGKDSEHILPWFDAIEYETQINMARDGAHPGPTSHRKFFERSLSYLK
jgi:hypothetical protein